LGAGYGPICIWLEKEYTLQEQMNNDASPIPQIYASEINERALWLLNRNLVDNTCHAIHVLKGDFLTHVPILQQQNIQFDAIYCNPPLKIGHEALLSLFQATMGLLKPHGFLQYVHLKKLGAEGFVQKLVNLQPTWSYVITRKKAGYHVFVISPQPIQFPDDETSIDNALTGYF
jgi:16S rRNA G1207 methylase RsmC